MAAGDATWNPKKNVAYRVTFPILDADGDLVTGATGLDSEVSKDGGTFIDCTNEATEIATSSGVYYLDLTSTEMNADTVAVIVKTSSSGAKTTVLVFYPLETTDTPVDVLAISGDTVAADNLEAAADGTGYNLGGGSIVAASVTAAVTANTTQLAGQTVTAAGAVTFPSTVSSLTAAGVRTELATELGRIDVEVSSRMATFTLPTNFAALGINGSGHLSRVTLVDTCTTNTDMRGTDNAALAASWTATRAGYLDSVLIAANANQRTVNVTGSNHVAADIHELQPAVIDSTHFAPGAIDSNALAASAATEIATATLGATVEGSETLVQAVRLVRAALVGKLSGAATTTVTIRDAADSKNRITATVTADGNRTDVTTDAT